MKFTYRTVAVLVALVCALFSPHLLAQASLTTTTTSAAVGLNDAAVTVTSATGFAANRMLLVDGELMQIQSTYSSGTVVPVFRGRNGTSVVAHASGATTTVALPRYVYDSPPPPGICTRANELVLPRIVAPTRTEHGASVYDCLGAASTTAGWVRYTFGGYQAPMTASTSSTGNAPTYTSAGALTVMPGVSYIGSAGALAMTLAAPSLLQNGMVMVIMASTAQAHTVTYTAGFFGTTTSSDVCTMGGAIGDQLTVVANNGVWRPISTRNCTIA